MIAALGLAGALACGLAPAVDPLAAEVERPGRVVRVPAGRHTGPWRLAAGVHLRAEPGASVEATAGATVTVEGDGVTLEGLTVRAPPGGVALAATGVRGLVLRAVRIVGGKRGLSLVRTRLAWRSGAATGGEEYGLWAQDSRVSVDGVDFEGAGGTAVYAAGGRAAVTRCDFAHSEYGLMAYGSSVDIRDCRFHGIRRAGAALVRSAARLWRARFEGPFYEAAVSVVGSPRFQMRRSRVDAAGAAGVKLLNSTAVLRGDRIAGAQVDSKGLEGDGLYLFDSEVDSVGDRLLDDGTGIELLGGRATVRACRIERSSEVAVDVGEKGSLALLGCVLADAPEGVAAEQGSAPRLSGTRFLRIGRRPPARAAHGMNFPPAGVEKK